MHMMSNPETVTTGYVSFHFIYFHVPSISYRYRACQFKLEQVN